MQRIEGGTRPFPFLAVLDGIFDPCTQGAHLHFTDSDDMQLNHKRSREAVYQLHDTANRGTVQSIRADGRYFTDQVSIDFSHRISSPYSSEANINLGGQRLRMSALILDG